MGAPEPDLQRAHRYWSWACLVLDGLGYREAARDLRVRGVSRPAVLVAERSAWTVRGPSPVAVWAAGVALQAADVVATIAEGDGSEGDWDEVERLLASVTAIARDHPVADPPAVRDA